ncbi:MAG TPA: outer membrane beta-barrel protein [Geobacteraceae bacterium]
MIRRLIPFIALVAAFVWARPAFADVKGDAFTISPFFGGYVHDGSQDLKAGYIGGLRLGYNLTGHWGMEGYFGYSEPKSEGHGKLMIAGGEVLYHFFPEKRVVPFFAIGGGWLRLLDSPTSSSDAGINYGGGLKYFLLNDTIALRLDVRHMYIFHTSANSSYWQNTQFTAGVSFQFGRPRAPVKPWQPAAAAAPGPTISEEQSSWLAENREAPAGKTMITGIKIEENALEIMATDRISDYKVFTLTQPSRLVIDIPNAVSGFSAPRIIVNRLGIGTLRFESYPEYLRIFLDASQGRLIPYRVVETEKGLKITVAP